MDSSQLRAIILKIEDRLSGDDRRRLHFFLGNDVPRRFRDDSSLSGTLSLMESLLDQDKINEKDFTFLINTFNQIKCFDAVKILKGQCFFLSFYRISIKYFFYVEHKKRMEINGQNHSMQDLRSILFQDQEDLDKHSTGIRK